MRKSFLTVSLALFAACGGDSATAPANGSVLFKIDALTCTGSGTVQLFVDGSIVGTETLAAGQTSQSYTVSAGSHVVGARLANSTFIWPNTTITVPANGSFTAIMPCR